MRIVWLNTLKGLTVVKILLRCSVHARFASLTFLAIIIFFIQALLSAKSLRNTLQNMRLV